MDKVTKVNFQREFSGGVLVLRSSSLLLEAQRRLVALSLSSKTFLLFSVPFSFRERSKLNKCFFFSLWKFTCWNTCYIMEFFKRYNMQAWRIKVLCNWNIIGFVMLRTILYGHVFFRVLENYLKLEIKN